MLKGKIIRSTEKAHLVEHEREEKWIPRSVFTYLHTHPPDEHGHKEARFTIEGWMLNRLGWNDE